MEDELTAVLRQNFSRRVDSRKLQALSTDRLELPDNFDRIVAGLESKFAGSEDRADCLVDITNLEVVRDTIYKPPTQVARSSLPHPVNNRSVMVRPLQRQRLSLPCREVREVPAISYMTPQYAAPTSSLVSYEPPNTSKVFDKEYQLTCINELCKQLKKTDDDAAFLRKHLQEKVQKTIGLSVLPTPGSLSLLPFVFCDDSGDFNVSFLFDSPPNTPWMQIVRRSFGTDMIQLQRCLYELICKQESGIGVHRQAVKYTNGSFEDSGEYSESAPSVSPSSHFMNAGAAVLSSRPVTATRPSRSSGRLDQAVGRLQSRKRTLNSGVQLRDYFGEDSSDYEAEEPIHMTERARLSRPNTGDTDYDDDSLIAGDDMILAPKRASASSSGGRSVPLSSGKTIEPPSKKSRVAIGQAKVVRLQVTPKEQTVNAAKAPAKAKKAATARKAPIRKASAALEPRRSLPVPNENLFSDHDDVVDKIEEEKAGKGMKLTRAKKLPTKHKDMSLMNDGASPSVTKIPVRRTSEVKRLSIEMIDSPQTTSRRTRAPPSRLGNFFM
ncbi:hypothetical protein HDE_11531 [Halotydeus destructor]|nr:hypothetical protein HDE_11531 [Halotydeus destructor]